jgi:23S rRNA (cytidine2498-2'-O)-methyltransferase
MTGYLAPEQYLAELIHELKNQTKIDHIYDRLVLTSDPPIPSVWSQNIWLNPRLIPVQSISQAARELKAIQRNWALYSFQLHRRAQLISEQLPKVSSKKIEFPEELFELKEKTKSPMGSWTLVEKDLLVASPHCSHPFPNGEVYFKENKKIPPSRAYLKLWESLTLIGQTPGAGDLCLDMGSSPGGWTWALHELGAQVISVDQASLTPEIKGLPRVRYLHQDAFTLDPHSIGKIDWFFSDVICYPSRLLELVQKWLKSGLCNKFICTIKFRGQEINSLDREVIRAFTMIPGSTVRHLFHNKHELTWIKI